MTGPRPLSGLRVLEVATGVAGAFCGRQFVNWGADVVMLEPQGGGRLREEGPLWRTARGQGSIPFEFLAAGKRAVADAPGVLTDLARRADVLICDPEPPGLSEIQAELASAVVVRISPFGLDGPRAGQAGGALEWQALSGYLSLNGPAGEPPLPAPGRILEHAVGANAFVGAMAALIRRRRTGGGGQVEVSGLETVAALVPYLREQHQGFTTRRDGGTPEGARLFRCADGYVTVAPAIPAHLPAYREVLGLSEDEAPDSLLSGDRAADVPRISATFGPRFARLPVQEVFLGLQVRGVVCGIVQDSAAVLGDPQLEARGFYARVDHPELGHLAFPGPAARIAGDAPSSLKPAPAAGSTAPASVGWDLRSAASGPAEGGPPLAGIMVVDLTQAWIGPMAGMLLGDLGAEVIKVEGPARPDIWRYLGQAPEVPGRPPTSPLNRSWYCNATNRNKRGLGLDLTTPAGRAIFLRLVEQADVVLENFTPLVMGRFGLGDTALASARPDLVFTSFSGFGSDGPFATFKANGASIEALAGWDALNRDATGNPVLMGTYSADPTGGLQMAAATLVGLYRRMETGAGARVDGSMLEASAEYIGDALLSEAVAQAGVDLEAVAAADSPAGAPVLTPVEAFDEPQLAARNWFIPIDAPGLGVSRHPGFLWRFDGTALAPPRPPPKLGEHSDEVLRERLGLSPAEVAGLRRDGVVGSEP